MKNELILTITNDARSPFSRDTSAASMSPIACTYRQVPVHACDVARRYSRMLRGIAESFLDISRVVCGGDPQ